MRLARRPLRPLVADHPDPARGTRLRSRPRAGFARHRRHAADAQTRHRRPRSRRRWSPRTRGERVAHLTHPAYPPAPGMPPARLPRSVCRPPDSPLTPSLAATPTTPTSLAAMAGKTAKGVHIRPPFTCLAAMAAKLRERPARQGRTLAQASQASRAGQTSRADTAYLQLRPDHPREVSHTTPR